MTEPNVSERYVRSHGLRTVVRDWFGRRLHDAHLYWLSGWWDAGTDRRVQ